MLARGYLSDRLEKNMDMVRHHAPRKKPVPRAVKFLQGIRNDRAIAVSLRKHRPAPASKLLSILRAWSCPILLRSAAVRLRSHLGGRRLDIFTLRSKFLESLFGQRIGQTKRDEVNCLLHFPVREATATNFEAASIWQKNRRRDAGATRIDLRVLHRFRLMPELGSVVHRVRFHQIQLNTSRLLLFFRDVGLFADRCGGGDFVFFFEAQQAHALR